VFNRGPDRRRSEPHPERDSSKDINASSCFGRGPHCVPIHTLGAVGSRYPRQNPAPRTVPWSPRCIDRYQRYGQYSTYRIITFSIAIMVPMMPTPARLDYASGNQSSHKHQQDYPRYSASHHRSPLLVTRIITGRIPMSTFPMPMLPVAMHSRPIVARLPPMLPMLMAIPGHVLNARAHIVCPRRRRPGCC
jgi:hypothetical protein